MNQQEATTETIKNQPPQRKKLQSVGAGVVQRALKHSPEVVQRRGADIVVRRLLRTPRFEVKNLLNQEDAQKALELEQEVWHEKSFGELDVYEKYLPQSRIFAAYDADGKVVGMNRLFAGAPEIPPFLSEMPIDDDNLKQKLIEDGKQFKLEEYGTAAVTKELRGTRAFLDICRVAFRDASERGIKTWGIIMEPERVQKMNIGLGFTFRQIGPAVEYQGGECAAHILDFDEVHAHMSTTKPQLYDWFINEPL